MMWAMQIWMNIAIPLVCGFIIGMVTCALIRDRKPTNILTERAKLIAKYRLANEEILRRLEHGKDKPKGSA